MAKFINIGYISKSSKFSETNQTYVLKVKPQDPAMKEIKLEPGSKVIIKPPRPKKGQSEEEFQEKVASWKMFDVLLVEESET
jgi:hypothetical protein